MIVCVVVLGDTQRVGICVEMLNMVQKAALRLVLPYCMSMALFGIVDLVRGRAAVDILSDVVCSRGVGAAWFLYAVAIVHPVIAVGVWLRGNHSALVLPVVG